MISKKVLAQKLKAEMVELQALLKMLQLKKPNHTFLFPTIGNAVVSIADLLIYLEGKNPYYPTFDEPAFNNRQTTMHRTFFSNLHVDVESGLRKIADDNNLQVQINRKNSALRIVASIKEKLTDTEVISRELNNVIKLGGKYPAFNDYLNTVLKGIPSLDKRYRTEARIYFDGLSIIRNKVSHSDISLTSNEKKKLVKAKLRNVISKDGNLQMTFEGYKPLVIDVIKFFDALCAHLPNPEHKPASTLPARRL